MGSGEVGRCSPQLCPALQVYGQPGCPEACPLTCSLSCLALVAGHAWAGVGGFGGVELG